MSLRAHGLPPSAVLAELEALRTADLKLHSGKAFTNAYLVSEQARELAEQAVVAMLWENGLDPTQFPSFRHMENQVVAVAADHLGAQSATDADVVGSYTSGGTESCMLAVKACRDRAIATGRVGDPSQKLQIILPQSAHPCFQKAAHYLGLQAIIVPLDPVSFQADPAAMAAAITGQTIMLVGSAVSYPHGVVDPIQALAELAQTHDLWLHVDGCIGGFMLPLFAELGAPVPAFDFTVPGVSSMSMDLHKYAFAPKGSSVVLYRTPDLRRYQFYTCSGWPGYTLVNSTIMSSRSAGPLAGTWAVMRHLGRDGYLEAARILLEGTRRVVAGIEAIDGLEVVGEPAMCLVALGAKDCSVFALEDALKRRGWSVFPQFSCGDLPATLHLTIVPNVCANIDAFLTHLGAAVAEVKAEPAPGGGVADMMAGLDIASLDDAQLEALVSGLGLGGGLPTAMADINTLLDALDATARDRVVRTFFDLLHRPEREGLGR